MKVLYKNNKLIKRYRKINIPNIKNDNIYNIPILEYNIYNDNTNPVSTTKGINDAIKYAKDNGYDGVKLPAGHYSIECDTQQGSHLMHNDVYGWDWPHRQYGIVMKDDLYFDITDCILELYPTEEQTHYSMLTFSGCNNVEVIGGTLIGDRYTHNYGHIINNDKQSLEVGGFDDDTGDPIDIEDTDVLRTIDFIDISDYPVPSYKVIPLEGTKFNTTDGGRCYTYCYDENDNFLGTCHADGWGGYCELTTLLEGTKKIKMSFLWESNLEAKWFIANGDDAYATLEWGAGIVFTDAKNCVIKNTKIIDFIGDGVATNCPPTVHDTRNIHFINCTIENCRRQGISLTGHVSGFFVKDCNIGYINGIDPQCGVDIEVEDGGCGAQFVVFDNCYFYMNKRADFDNFNGHDVILKNCRFHGTVGSVYGSGIKAYNNVFEYKLLDPNPKNSHPVCKSAGIACTGDNNECYLNEFINASAFMGNGFNNRIHHNIFKDNSTMTVSKIKTHDNKYYNSRAEYGVEIYGDGNDEETTVYNEEYHNSIVQNMNRIKDSIFYDTDVYCQGAPNTSEIIDCEFNFDNVQFLQKASGFMDFKNCIFNVNYNDKCFFATTFVNMKFDNCEFNMPTTLADICYNDATIINSTFNFIDNFNSTKDRTLINAGYQSSVRVYYNNIFNKTFETPRIYIPVSPNSYLNGEPFDGDTYI